MCWKTINEAFKLPIKAEENVPIFKICISFPDAVVSAYQHFEYSLNKEYTMDRDIDVIGDNLFCIHQGFHSYSEKCKIYLCGQNGFDIIGVDGEYLDGFGFNFVKVLGYIPKGAYYYINENGECVSSSICLTSIEYPTEFK